jgi:hypothetical protein
MGEFHGILVRMEGHGVKVSVLAETSLRRAVMDRVLNEMLGSVKDSAGGGWKVLILDDVTTRYFKLIHFGHGLCGCP